MNITVFFCQLVNKSLISLQIKSRLYKEIKTKVNIVFLKS